MEFDKIEKCYWNFESIFENFAVDIQCGSCCKTPKPYCKVPLVLVNDYRSGIKMYQIRLFL